MLIHMNIFFLCTFIAFCCGRRCQRRTRAGTIEQFCCNNYEFRDGHCVECENGFVSYSPGEPCRPCSHDTFGRKSISICQCNINERCDHVNGCLKVLPSTETGTTNDHFEGTSFPALEHTEEIKSKIGIDDSKIPLPSIIVTSTVLILLVFVSVIWVCWKYEVPCKKRKQITDRSTTETSFMHAEENKVYFLNHTG